MRPMVGTVIMQDSLAGGSGWIAPSMFDRSKLAEEISVSAGGMHIVERMADHPPFWHFLFLFTLLASFAWILRQYGTLLNQTVSASFNFQVSSRMFNDNSQLQIQLDTVLYGFYLLSFSFLLYLLEERNGFRPYGLKGGLLYLFNLGLLSGVLLFRWIIVNMTGFLFGRTRLYREYLYNALIYNKVIGITVIPALIFLAYAGGVLQQIFVWLAIALTMSIYIARIIRGISFSVKKDISILYLILYICALEIVPLLLLYRWLEGILNV